MKPMEYKAGSLVVDRMGIIGQVIGIITEGENLSHEVEICWLRNLNYPLIYKTTVISKYFTVYPPKP